MPEIIQCPLCRRQLQVDKGSHGQWFKCPSCQGTFKIAAVEQAPAPARPVRPVDMTPPPRPRIEPKVWQPPPPDKGPPRPLVVHEELDLKKQAAPLPEHPHRGLLILALGFIGLAFFAISPVGWILGGMAMAMGKDDLGRMHRGTMHKGGEAMTLVGWVCGLIAVILSTVVVFWYMVIFFQGTLGKS